jgi:hypothetical protein
LHHVAWSTKGGGTGDYYNGATGAARNGDQLQVFDRDYDIDDDNTGSASTYWWMASHLPNGCWCEGENAANSLSSLTMVTDADDDFVHGERRGQHH